MQDFIPLPEGKTWPLNISEGEPICFRTLGQLLASSPWCSGLFGQGFSHADHLLLLASHVRKSVRLEALLLHAHRPLVANAALPTVCFSSGKPKLEIQRAPLPSIHFNTVRFQIRHAAGLDSFQPEEIESYLFAVEASVIRAELRDMNNATPGVALIGAVDTKFPIRARPREVVAAEWAEKVETLVPRIMATRAEDDGEFQDAV